MLKKIINGLGYFKVCATRVNAFWNFVYLFILMSIYFDGKGISKEWLILIIPLQAIIILVLGTLDMKFGLWKREAEIGHKQSPVLMETLTIVRKLYLLFKKWRLGDE